MVQWQNPSDQFPLRKLYEKYAKSRYLPRELPGSQLILLLGSEKLRTQILLGVSLFELMISFIDLISDSLLLVSSWFPYLEIIMKFYYKNICYIEEFANKMGPLWTPFKCVCLSPFSNQWLFIAYVLNASHLDRYLKDWNNE